MKKISKDIIIDNLTKEIETLKKENEKLYISRKKVIDEDTNFIDFLRNRIRQLEIFADQDQKLINELNEEIEGEENEI